MEKRKRLLIVTNDPALQEWFKAFFREYEDLEGDILPDTREVRRFIAETRPEALFLDITPPEGRAHEDVLGRTGQAWPGLPVIAVTAGGAESRLQSLKCGAYACIDKPIISSEEVYLIANNAIKEYAGRRESAAAASEIERKREADKLSLLELELVKGLQHMIGETEEPAAIFKHAFSLIKNYLSFEAFAALVPRQGEFEIYVYPNVRLGEEIGEVITGTLIRKMTRLAEQEREQKVKVVVAGKEDGRPPSDDLKSVIIPLATSSRTCGYAGIYRGTPFDYDEESVFKRFCAHIAIALEKINLFEEIKSLSVSDGLTGLLNHVSIVAKLDQEVQRSRRYGSPLSIIMFDIDNFKEVNDTSRPPCRRRGARRGRAPHQGRGSEHRQRGEVRWRGIPRDPAGNRRGRRGRDRGPLEAEACRPGLPARREGDSGVDQRRRGGLPGGKGRGEAYRRCGRVPLSGKERREEYGAL